MATLAIDPGAKHSAFAVVIGNEVLQTWYQQPLEDLQWRPWARVVCEGQYISPGKGYAANDMLKVAFAAGVAAQKYSADEVPLYYVLPSQWKGSVPKKIHQERILSRLSVEDRFRLEEYPKTIRHNVIDAIGIGLWAEAIGNKIEQYRYGGTK